MTTATTATRRNVALCKVGTWAASTGVTKITERDLDDMALAYADQIVDRPVIKVGHEDDNAFNAAGLGDGEPAFGWVENVGRGDGSEGRPDRNTLYGDYVGMPSKFAAVSDTAWRRRSVEIAWGVKTAANKVYAAVLTGVALLGVERPAIKGLGDVLALYSEAIATDDDVTRLVVGDDVPELDFAQLTAFAASLGDDTGSVPHGNGGGSDSDSDTTTASADQDTEGKRMTIKKADVEAALAQAENDDVTELVQGLLAGVTDESGQGGDLAGVLQAGIGWAPQGNTTTTTVTDQGAATDTPETVTVSKEVWEEMQTAAATITKDRRDRLVETAFRAGKITGAERATWRAKLDENEAVTAPLLEGMAARFSTVEQGDVGSSHFSQGSEPEQTAWDDFTASMIPGGV